MRICHLILHSCIRVHKLAQAQRTQGSVTPYLYNSVFASQHPHWQYKLVFKMFAFNDQLIRAELAQHMSEIDPLVDAWHIHNTPDLFAPICREVTEKPIFWDVHDLRSHQHQDDSFRTAEDASAKAADHIFTVSQEYEDMLKHRYPGKSVSHYRSMVPVDWMPKPSEVKKPGLVYEGGISKTPGHYRNIFPYVEKCAVKWHVYPSADVVPGEYLIPENCTLSQSTPVFELFRAMTEYEAGFVGTAVPHQAFDGALPNKLFEYIACGIPIIAAHVPAVSRLIEDLEIGITCDDPAEVPDALEKIRKDNYRKRVVELRHKFSIDHQNRDLVEPVYRDFLG